MGLDKNVKHSAHNESEKSSHIYSPNWTYPQCPPIGEWMKKLWYIQPTENSTVNEMNKPQLHVTSWEWPKYYAEWKKQTQRSSHYVVPFTDSSKAGKTNQ